VEWEITEHVRLGEVNRLDLSMVVDTLSEKVAGASKYAHHNLGGIHRSVSIYALPPVNVRSLRVTTDLDANYIDADLQLKLAIDNPTGKKTEGLSLEVALFDATGKAVSHSTAKVDFPAIDSGETAQVLSTRVKSPAKWNAEKPNLYRLALTLQQDGRLLERIERQVGFREIEVRGSRFLVNGVAVKLAGVCRHEIDPLSGRADTMRHAENDLRLFKAANLNYIRGVHYPPTIELVEAADKYGMYLEIEAPVSLVRMRHYRDPTRLPTKVLEPTSAMIDYYGSHPSVVLWSLANECDFPPFFITANQMIKQLDPSRPTTFNFPDDLTCDVANLHYPPTPYDKQTPHDPRPIVLGEYYFPVCHEQTDVRINPGLREFYGFGHSDPDSAWGRECAKSYAERIPYLKPGLPPGTWTSIVRSNRIVGGAIFAGIDDSFYFSDGSHAGYSWEHGFWGLLDAWRRPKPEYWLSKMVFSPVWFPSREIEFVPGQSMVSIPVENRYSFTDLSELRWEWEIEKAKGTAKIAAAPGDSATLEVPVSPTTAQGSNVIVRVFDAEDQLINVAAIQLGTKAESPLPTPTAGAPEISEAGDLVVISGQGFSLVFDKARGDFRAEDARHQSAITRFPSLHLTRFDFGDLASDQPPYAVFPDRKTRVVESATVEKHSDGLILKVKERYDHFAGNTTWLLDKNGRGKIDYDYTYSGERMSTRELGVRLELKPECDVLKWNRWSEWSIFPEDSISRTQGTAKAMRAGNREVDPENIRPTWPWSQDQTELGTTDFRSIKFNIYAAELTTPHGPGLRLLSNAKAHLRCNLTADAVQFHALSRCRMGQIAIQAGSKLQGSFTTEILSKTGG
jgi:hypothetical protein